jgi:hypothetical protein
MNFNDQYEQITDDEANFILDIHEAVDKLVRHNIPVTLVRLGFELNITPSELGDYIHIIVSILDKVEEKYSV